MLPAEMLSEPIAVQPVYVSGLARIDYVGDGMWELTCYQLQRSTFGEEEKVIATRTIASTAALLLGVRMVMKALGYCCCGAVARKIRH